MLKILQRNYFKSFENFFFNFERMFEISRKFLKKSNIISVSLRHFNFCDFEETFGKF